jgi:enoyl-CoA hydratase/carnithine racemase
MMSYAHLVPEHFLWRLENEVGAVTLNRPEKKNPLTFASYAELCELFRGLGTTAEVKAVIISGAGGNFCSGGDVHEIIGPLTRMSADELLQFTRMTGELVLQMRLCPQPIIAAVDGVCAGAGACIAMAADLRLATANARTAFLFTRVGLAGCDMGACAILPRIIGQGRASELLYSGRAMSAQEGEAWGFFNRIVPAEELQTRALELAQEIARGPTRAHAMTKQMLHREWSLTVEAAIEAEAQAQAACMQSEDFKRAYRAFAAKQRPIFKGD